MARHPTARRTPKKAEPDDAFIESVLEATVWAKQHRRLLTAGILVLVLLVGGGLYYRYYTRITRESAAIQLLSLQGTANAGNPALTVREGQLFLQQYGNTPSGDEARIILAEAFLESGQHQEAINTLQPIAGDFDDPIGVSAAFLLAAAHEVATRYPEAIEAYLRIADRAPYEYQQVRALENVARIHMQQSNPAAAVEIYDRLLTLVGQDGPEAPVYRLRRAEALARASNG